MTKIASVSKCLLLGVVVSLPAWGEPVTVETLDGVEISIRATRDDPRVLKGREKLVRILQQHELRPWIVQREIVISDEGIPHSHPELTLTTGPVYFDDDNRQLSSFIHEQIHWYLDEKENKVALGRILSRLRELYPEVPVGGGQGARSAFSTRLHLVVNWLELDAGVELLGEAEARRIASTYSHYRWIYERVLEDTAMIGAIIAGEGLAITPDRGLTAGRED